MLTSHVIVSRQSAGSAPCSPLTATSHVTKFPVVHPLSIQQVTKCFSRNSFVLKTIHFYGGYPPAGSSPRQSPLDYLFPILYPLSFHILAHSFALFCTHQKLNPFLFIRFHTLRQKTAQRGVPPRFSTRIKMNQAEANSCATNNPSGRVHLHSTGNEGQARPRFASHPHGFLVNYIDPFPHRVGLAGHSSHSTRGPRS